MLYCRVHLVRGANPNAQDSNFSDLTAVFAHHHGQPSSRATLPVAAMSVQVGNRQSCQESWIA